MDERLPALIWQDPIHRQYHHNLLTFSLMYAYSENYLLPISHDEVVHGKGSLLRKTPGAATTGCDLRAYLAYMWSHPGKQLLFMGSEFAQEAEWADGRELDWWLLDHAAHYRVHNMVKQLNSVYKDNPALRALDALPAGFEWLTPTTTPATPIPTCDSGPRTRRSGGGRAGLRRSWPGRTST